jgi:hypothetical protein
MVSHKVRDTKNVKKRILPRSLTPPVIDEIDFAGNGEISARSGEEMLFQAKGQSQHSEAASINKTRI